MNDMDGSVSASAQGLQQSIAFRGKNSRRSVGSEFASLERATRLTIAAEVSAPNRTYGLSPMQAGMLFHARAEPRPGVDFQQLVAAAEHLDVQRYVAAWRTVVARHDILRTSFHWRDLAVPHQCVHPEVSLPVEVLDLRLLDGARQKEELAAFLRRDRQRGFSLEVAPLLRLTLLRLSDEQYEAVWSFHHILLDGRSFLTVLREVYRIYDAACAGHVLTLDEPTPFADFIAWFEKRDHSVSEAYFRKTLGGLEPVGLPIVRSDSAPPDEGAASGRVTTQLERADSQRLRDRAAAEGVTGNTMMQAAWSIVLSAYSGTTDVVFGATRAGRHSTIPGAESMVGLAINSLPIRVQFDESTTVRALLVGLREQWVALRAHEHTPLSKVQEWSGARPGTSLFESLMVVENYDWKEALRREGAVFEKRSFEIHERTSYPMTLAVDLGERITIDLEFDVRRISRAAASQILGHLAEVLRKFSDPQISLDARAVDIDVLTDNERTQIVKDWNASERQWEHPSATVHGLVEHGARVFGDHKAVEDEQGFLTYRELDAKASRLARQLVALGVRPQSMVALAVDRSNRRAIALLAILKAGAAYVPLDADYPAARLKLMLEETGADLLLTDPIERPHFESLLAASLEVPETSADGSRPASLAAGATEPPAAMGAPVVRLFTVGDDGLLERTSEAPGDLPAVMKSDLAYVLYTSGSTGKPKAVLVEHGSVVNHAYAMARLSELGPTDRSQHAATLCFDMSVFELFPSWAAGACVVMRPSWATSPERVGPWIESNAISVLHVSTALWHQWTADLVATGATLPLCLKLIHVGGEQASRATVEQFRTLSQGRVRWINNYGPTEATVQVTAYECPTDSAVALPEGPVSVGRPIDNCRAYILSPQQRPVPIGVPGELYIGGDGLARGYLNRPELTAERFVALEIIAGQVERLYRTGDLAKYLPTGDIEIVGRLDHQVKVRGFRVELGEIEAELEKHSRVRQAVAIARQAGVSKRIDAYVVPRAEDQRPTPSELRQFLSSTMPDFMIPATISVVERFATTPSGKIDRKALPEPTETTTRGQTGYVAPRTPAEEVLANIWAQQFGCARVSVHDDFFSLGGDSLMALRVLDRASHAGLTFDPSDLFRHSTVAELASVAKPQFATGGGTHASLVAMRRTGSRPPLYFVHTTPGDLFGYSSLVRALGSEQPCFGFQSRGLYDPATAHKTIDEMAHAYVDELLLAQPEGPYHLTGWCYGGVIAYEMARVLEKRGARCGAIALIEATAPSPPPVSEDGRTFFGYYMDVFASFQRMPLRERTDYLKKRVFAGGGYLKRRDEPVFLAEEVSSGPLANRRVVSELNVAALTTYNTRTFGGRITVIGSSVPLEGSIPDPSLRWDRLASSVESYVVDGSHEGILREPAVLYLAATLRSAIDRATREEERVPSMRPRSLRP